MLKGRICVIGKGRWGTSLAAALRAGGNRPFVVAGSAALARPGDPKWLQAEIFWLCVPDSQIASAAALLVERLSADGHSLAGRKVLHSSGVHNVAVLAAAEKAGALVGSVHPLMTFPTRTIVGIRNVPFAVEAGRQLRNRLFHLVKSIGGQPFAVSSEGKALYHASAVMASPLLVSLASAAQSLAQAAGIPRPDAVRILRPIMEATVQNFFDKGGVDSFSGPFARGDVDTISLHLQALQSHPSWERIYRSLGLNALQSLPAVNKARLQQILQDPGVPAASAKGSSTRQSQTKHGRIRLP